MQVSEADEQASIILDVTTTFCCSKHIWMTEELRRKTRTRSSRLSSIDQVSHLSFRAMKLTLVFKTLEKELVHGGLEGLTPIDRMDLAAGMAVSCCGPERE